jgi:hypothetical protein
MGEGLQTIPQQLSAQQGPPARNERAEDLRKYFDKQTKEESERTRRREFRVHERRVKRARRTAGREGRRRRQEQHKQDRTIGITTQNVRCMAASTNSLNLKLQGFKEQHLRGNRDVCRSG